MNILRVVNQLPGGTRRNLIGVLLYAFGTGLVFWWAIEQLFINDISDNGSQLRGYSTAAYSIAFTLANLPLGSFSDRYGRRLSMGLSACVRIAVFVFLANSTESWHYVLGFVAYAVAEAFDDGAVEAYIYDTLKDAKQSKQYERFSGLSEAFFLAGAGVAGVSGGFLAEAVGLPRTYIWSAVPAIGCLLVVILLMHEPAHHRDRTQSSLGRIKGSIGFAIKPTMLRLGVATLAAIAILDLPTEFGQLQYLEIDDSYSRMGIFWGIFGIVLAVGAAIAYNFRGYSKQLFAIAGLLTLVMTLTGGWLGIVLLVVVSTIGQILAINIDARIQDQAPSDKRTTISSVFGVSSGVLMAIIYLVTGWLGESQPAHIAQGLILLPLALIAALTLSRAKMKQ